MQKGFYPMSNRNRMGAGENDSELTLQAITDNGNTSTNGIKIADLEIDYNGYVQFQNAGNNKFLLLKGDNITTNSTLQLPNGSGTLVLTINSQTADTIGNLDLSLQNICDIGSVTTTNITAASFTTVSGGSMQTSDFILNAAGNFRFTDVAGNYFFNFTAPTLAASKTITLPTMSASSNYLPISVNGNVANSSGDITLSLTSGTVTSVTGTTNRITVATGTTTPVIDISSSYVGQTSITVIGTLPSLTLTGSSSNTYAAGKLVYDTNDESLIFYNNDSNVALNIGQEEWIRVRNVSGSSISNGKAVYISGTDISSGLPTIELAQADNNTTTQCVGLTTETIINNGVGYVTRSGLVRGLNTSSFTAGAILFLSDATPGSLTTTAPTTANHFKLRVGVVTKSHTTTGTILVSVHDEYENINYVSSVTGTTNRITIGGTSVAPTVDISTSYVGQSSITTLGTITTGTWNGTAIGTIYGGTGLTSYTTGDLLYASATNVLSKLAIGTNGYVLTIVAGVPAWAAASGGGGGVTSVSGTTNRISSTGGATPVIDISASYIGQSSITTLGTITTGVWNGTAITDTYISSAATWNAKQNALSGTGFVKISGTTISYDNSTYLTSNQTITFTGDVTGSGTTSVALTIGASKVLNSMLAGSIDADKISSGTVSNTEFNYLDGVTSSIQTQLDAKVAKSAAAYTIRANNTNGTANVTDETYKQIGAQTITSGTPSWTAGTAPSGTENHSYTWSQVGKIVTIWFYLTYTSPGATCTAVVFPLPTDCPAPLELATTGGGGDYLYMGAGYIGTQTTTTPAVMARTTIRVNAGDTGWEVYTTSTSVSARVCWGSVSYRAA